MGQGPVCPNASPEAFESAWINQALVKRSSQANRNTRIFGFLFLRFMQTLTIPHPTLSTFSIPLPSEPWPRPFQRLRPRNKQRRLKVACLPRVWSYCRMLIITSFCRTRQMCCEKCVPFSQVCISRSYNSQSAEAPLAFARSRCEDTF